MLQQLINHSSDIRRLRDEGYELEFSGGYLIIHHIPYIGTNKAVLYGSLITSLNLVGYQTGVVEDHVIHFIGENPLDFTGKVISSIQLNNDMTDLGNGLISSRSFSNKPREGYKDYHHKVTRYVDIISGPARFVDEHVTAKTFKVYVDHEENTPFNYCDTNSSRANINNINLRLENIKVAIIGLGGTGSYILDLISKSNVKEIHLYDADTFDQHNAFRSPGAASIQDLIDRPLKVDYLFDKYSVLRKGIFAHQEFVTISNLNSLLDYQYIFLCVDNNRARGVIAKFLHENNIPFSDVGLGVSVFEEMIIGSVRVSNYRGDKSNRIFDHIPLENNVENEYTSNIQIAELNCLNASLAVIQFKKHFDFYNSQTKNVSSVFSIGSFKIISEDDCS